MTNSVVTGGELPGRALPDMSDRQFQRWVSLLEARTGMNMPRARRSFLVTNVALRMREVGFDDYDAYYEYLTSGLNGRLEWTHLVDRLTVHETRFFRDERALRLLTSGILPELVRRPGWDGDINVWSVGCSSGEEAYTLAMVVDAFARSTDSSLRFGITGTDISLRALATARAAVYSARAIQRIPDDMRVEYCEPAGPGRARIKRALRRRVAFALMNILDVNTAAPRRMDVIYCQNLLIYFAQARRLKIVAGLARHLRPGGVLILGAGEMLHWRSPDVVRVANDHDVLAYRRLAE